MTDQSGNDAFDSKPKETPSQDSPQTGNDYANLLASIKNERGEQKYDSLDKALEALNHSQSYIPQLKTTLQEREAELARIKADLEKRESIDDVVSRLTGNQKPQDQNSQPAAADKGLNEKTVEQIVEEMLQKKQTETSAQENRRKVNDALSQAFGDKVADVVAEKAKELGISPKELGEMASQKPNVVLALFNSKGQKPVSPTTGSLYVPPSNPNDQPLERPKKSLLLGATAKEQIEYMKKIREDVYKRFEVTIPK